MDAMTSARACLIAVVVVLGAGACRGNNPDQAVAYAAATGGSAARGRVLIVERNCGACHTIPGVRAARGLVAPPLVAFSRRTFIAGEVPNTPANLIQWVQAPQSIEPRTAMPAVGLSDQQARDVAAYLYTLR
jgi:cytochrome c1